MICRDDAEIGAASGCRCSSGARRTNDAMGIFLRHGPASGFPSAWSWEHAHPPPPLALRSSQTPFFMPKAELLADPDDVCPTTRALRPLTMIATGEKLLAPSVTGLAGVMAALSLRAG